MLHNGDKVIINEVGVEATFVRMNGGEAEIDICGVKFWMPTNCLSLIEDEAAAA